MDRNCNVINFSLNAFIIKIPTMLIQTTFDIRKLKRIKNYVLNDVIKFANF